jgi:hypothetical protein
MEGSVRKKYKYHDMYSRPYRIIDYAFEKKFLNSEWLLLPTVATII